MTLRLLALTMLTVVHPFAALAQIPIAHPRQMAANMIGIIEYCNNQGFVSDEAVADAREAYQLPPNPCVGDDPAEVGLFWGRKGELAFTDQGHVPLDTYAQKSNQTVEAVCLGFAKGVHMVVEIFRQTPRPPMPNFGCVR